MRNNKLPPVIFKEKILKVGIIADIHADSQTIRSYDDKTPGNIIYPVKYGELFPKALQEMKSEDVNFLVLLGDNTNDSSLKHARNLKTMIDNAGLEAFSVKGNHDNKEAGVMETLGANERYYYRDKEDWRVVILDTNEEGNGSGSGGMSEDQLNWFREISDADKKIIVFMHHPIFKREEKEKVDPIYENFFQEIKGNKRIKYVISGHWHVSYWEREENKIKFIGIPAFLLRDMEGYYKTIDLISYKWFWEND